jgi:uncharacterized protein YegL
MNTQNQNVKPMTIVRSGVKRPNWICSIARQMVVLVRDASGSMWPKKAKDASGASQNLVDELAQPSNKDGFSVAVVDFSSASKVVHKMEKATSLNGKLDAISSSLFGGSTNITAGLKDALAILNKAEGQGEDRVSYLRPVVIVFTDGCHNHGPAPHDVANLLKEKADLVTVAFGRRADETLMRDLASTPQHFYRCSTGRELRSFLAAVGTTMSASIAAGVSATEPLSSIQQ